VEIRRMDLATAGEEELRAAFQVNSLLRAERDPNAHPHTYEQFISELRSIPSMVSVTVWLAFDGDRAVANADYASFRTEENQHLAQFSIGVLPEYRRRGIGTRLFALIAEIARRENRQTIGGATYSTVPAGEAVMRRIGATIGMTMQQNEQELAEVDRDLVRRWIDQAPERASGFELGWWDGPYPEESLEDVAAMLEATNLQPRGEIDLEDMHFTVDMVREMESSFLASGKVRWTVYARERSTGRIAGFHEISFYPDWHDVIDVGFTGVFAEFQNRGLGRWLKAAMTQRILDELPDAKRVVTGNATVNEPMLNINHALGFRPAHQEVIWQMPVETAEAYLAGRSEEVSA
jgi:mycothiol synthase